MTHCHPLHGTYACASCNHAFCMTCDAPIAGEDLEIKTIGGRFCDACLESEAEANGITVEQVQRWRVERKARRLAEYPGVRA